MLAKQFRTKEFGSYTLSYLVGVILFSLYGVRVCPFLESLGSLYLIQEISLPCFVGFVIRSLLLEQFRSDKNGASQAFSSKRKEPWLFFLTDLVVWYAIGAYLVLVHYFNFGAPLESNLKVGVGCVVIGMFNGAYSFLRREYFIIISGATLSEEEVGKAEKYFSLGKLFLLLLIIVLFSSSIVSSLVVYKGFLWISEQQQHREAFSLIQYRKDMIGIMKEIAFVLAAFVGASIVIMQQFTKNMAAILDNYQEALETIKKGDYSVTIPLSGHDEFAVIADWINILVAQLEDKERVRKVFGKYINPEVAEKVLQEGEEKIKGRAVEVAIMFTDIRNFTPIAGQLSPEELVPLLNDYFSLLVEIIHKYNGSIDKFIGDATMSVFGLYDQESSCNNAVKAALEMQRQLRLFNEKMRVNNLPPMQTGVGIDYGRVVAGNIGSYERLEYTVIGESVNVASRLESMSKNFEKNIVFGEEVYNLLDEDLKKIFPSLGKQEIRGKEEAVEIFANSPHWLTEASRYFSK